MVRYATVWCVVLGWVGAAAAQDTAQAVIQRAIKAHGGEERLAKMRADKVQLKGTLLVGDKEGKFTAETTVQLPSQFKNVVNLTLPERKFTLAQVLNGDKAAVTINGDPAKIEPAALDEMRETLHLDRAVRLVPLLTDKTFELKLLGESKVNDRAAVGVSAGAKGHRELKMYFDRETGLLVKTQHVLKDGNTEVMQEEIYGDFKDFQGYRRPTRVLVYRAGKKLMDAELVDVKYFDKLDDSEFTKP